MARNYKINKDLTYLEHRPIKLKYRVVAGPDVHELQKYDLVFDEIDLKIRQMDTEDNLKYLKAAQSR